MPPQTTHTSRPRHPPPSALPLPTPSTHLEQDLRILGHGAALVAQLSSDNGPRGVHDLPGQDQAVRGPAVGAVCVVSLDGRGAERGGVGDRGLEPAARAAARERARAIGLGGQRVLAGHAAGAGGRGGAGLEHKGGCAGREGSGRRALSSGNQRTPGSKGPAVHRRRGHGARHKAATKSLSFPPAHPPAHSQPGRPPVTRHAGIEASVGCLAPRLADRRCGWLPE